jgi:hypothetical protein
MKTFLSTLAITLAITFMATPAEAGLTDIQKCEVFRAKTEMNFSKCMKIANLLEAKGKTADRAKCVTKYDDGIAKAKTKFVNEKLNVTEAECGLEQASTDAVKALDIVSAGQELATFGLDDSDLAIGTDIQSLIDEAVAEVDITSDNAGIAAAAAAAAGSAACTQAGGTWDAGASTCTPAYAPQCFLSGFCDWHDLQAPAGHITSHEAWLAGEECSLAYDQGSLVGYRASGPSCFGGCFTGSNSDHACVSG